MNNYREISHEHYSVSHPTNQLTEGSALAEVTKRARLWEPPETETAGDATRPPRRERSGDGDLETRSAALCAAAAGRAMACKKSTRRWSGRE